MHVLERQVRLLCCRSIQEHPEARFARFHLPSLARPGGWERGELPEGESSRVLGREWGREHEASRSFGSVGAGGCRPLRLRQMGDRSCEGLA